MSSWAPEAGRLIARPKGPGENGRTRVRVQVVSLCICAVASSAFVAAATNLPWFGDLSPGNPSPQYSAVSASGLYAPPGSQAALGPGTQSWGYLLVAWSALLTVLAVIAVAACVLSRHRRRGGVNVLLSVGIASLVLIALIIPEFTARVQFDLVSFVGFSWGAMVGLGLAVVAASGAWFAWATLKFPHLWGVEPTVD